MKLPSRALLIRQHRFSFSFSFSFPYLSRFFALLRSPLSFLPFIYSVFFLANDEVQPACVIVSNCTKLCDIFRSGILCQCPIPDSLRVPNDVLSLRRGTRGSASSNHLLGTRRSGGGTILSKGSRRPAQHLQRNTGVANQYEIQCEPRSDPPSYLRPPAPQCHTACRQRA